ncbi:hypothetical protein [Serratia sp. UGAL515B_01]|uniref:hypothetical protein n=1 Tax=Serratia sp. UGAL515B_01 TaxID=2986763 RepID=UPI002952F05E|nr:hypothetical protein [Serratia sp. UGAL515B_01]WON76810.1 hypothetical protein OK023_16735 [Serratia sp. UGAL515B_01]
MDFSKERLLASGFTERELQILQNNIDSFGGTMEEVIRDLAKRFKIFLWVFFCSLAFFLFLIYSKHDDLLYVFSGGVSLLIAVLIIALIQPPIISYKSWRFCRVGNN